jgi:hypothetical protein
MGKTEKMSFPGRENRANSPPSRRNSASMAVSFDFAADRVIAFRETLICSACP